MPTYVSELANSLIKLNNENLLTGILQLAYVKEKDFILALITKCRPVSISGNFPRNFSWIMNVENEVKF